MNVSSKRFGIKSLGGGLVAVRDRDAPYHCHPIPAVDLPSVERMAQMNEEAFDRAVSKAIYS